MRTWATLLFSVASVSVAAAQCSGPEPIATTIPAVRGQGSPSACTGKVVMVTGVITASMPGLGGFFLQDPEGDGDPTTSDAIFVLAGSGSIPDPGSLVQVSGKVFESTHPGQPGSVTALDVTTGSVQPMGTAPLPPAVVLDPTPDQQLAQPNAYFQALEGMLVEYPASTVMTPNDDSGVFYTLRTDRLPAGGRVSAANPGSGLPVLIDTAGGTLVFAVNELDTVGHMTGVLHFDNGLFRFQPLGAFDTANTGITPQAATADQPFLNIASLDAAQLTATLPPDEFNTRLAKLSMAIQNELRSPDVIAVQGVGDSATIIKLAEAAGDSYFGLLLKSCTPTTGSVGLIFNMATTNPMLVRQYNMEAPQFAKPACKLPDGQAFTNPLFENSVLRVDMGVASGSTVTLLLNDWRSPVAKPDQQAVQGVLLLQRILASIDQPNLIVLGDFNQTEDSAALKALEQNLSVTNLSRSTDTNVRYSVVQSGSSQAFDHIFVSAPMMKSVISSGFAHYNADFSAIPNREDATTPLRVSDHDSPFVHFRQF